MDNDFPNWICCNDNRLTCPPEGCPKSFGCAREVAGWKPGDPTPNGCLGIKDEEVTS